MIKAGPLPHARCVAGSAGSVQYQGGSGNPLMGLCAQSVRWQLGLEAENEEYISRS